MFVFGLSRTDKKDRLVPPPVSLEKNKSAFLGCFSENHSNGCPDLKNKDRFIKFHLHGSRRQKDAQNSLNLDF